jgi:hypothetical protein
MIVRSMDRVIYTNKQLSKGLSTDGEVREMTSSASQHLRIQAFSNR